MTNKPSGCNNPRGALDAGNMSTCVTGAQRCSAGIETQGITPRGNGHVTKKCGTDHPTCIDQRLRVNLLSPCKERHSLGNECLTHTV
jgi:hypothetical protein